MGKRGSGCSSVESCWWKRACYPGHDCVLDGSLATQPTGDLKIGLGVVHQVVPFCHVFWHGQAIDQAGDQFLITHHVAKVMHLLTDACQVRKVAAEGVVGLNGAVEFRA